MSTYTAVARSNYFNVTDLERLETYLKPFNVRLYSNKETNKYTITDQSSGGFSSVYDRKGNEIEWDPMEILHCIPKGEVFITMEVGDENLRYISGYAEAFMLTEEGEMKSEVINLSDIYKLAAERFNIPLATISAVEY